MGSYVNTVLLPFHLNDPETDGMIENAATVDCASIDVLNVIVISLYVGTGFALTGVDERICGLTVSPAVTRSIKYVQFQY